jgi:hypothetical protein
MEQIITLAVIIVVFLLTAHWYWRRGFDAGLSAGRDSRPKP